MARPCRAGWCAGSGRGRTSWTSSCKPARRSPTPTRPRWCTAISSPTTCWSARKVGCGSWTLAWRAGSGPTTAGTSRRSSPFRRPLWARRGHCRRGPRPPASRASRATWAWPIPRGRSTPRGGCRVTRPCRWPAWPAPTSRGASTRGCRCTTRSPRPARSWARRATWRPSSSRAPTPTPARISSASAWPCTRPCIASIRSRATPPTGWSRRPRAPRCCRRRTAPGCPPGCTTRSCAACRPSRRNAFIPWAPCCAS